MFLQQRWDYIATSDSRITDGSLITVGRGPFCLSLYNDRLDIVVEAQDAAITDTSVCKWTLEEDRLDPELVGKYKRIFNGSLTRGQIGWHSCGGSGGSGGDGLGPYPIGGSTTPAPPPMTTTIDPFSIFQGSKVTAILRARAKKVVGKHGRSSYQRGNMTNWMGDGGSEPGQPNPGTGKPIVDEWDFSEDYYIILDPAHCEMLPPKVTSKSPQCEEAPTDEETCTLFKKSLSIDVDPPVELDSWRKNVLDVASNIFSKICEPFPSHVPFTVSRALGYLLNKTKAQTVTQRAIWTHLTAELERCDTEAKPMSWYWDNKEDSNVPHEAEHVTCVIQSCSDGCEINETKSGESACHPSFDCSKTHIECPSPCALDPTTGACTFVLQNEDSDGSNCSSTLPTCPDPCVLHKGVCINQECRVVTCSPEKDCKPSYNGSQCEMKRVDDGAYPTANALSSNDIEADLQQSGAIAGPPSSNAILVDYPLNEIVVTHEFIHPKRNGSYDFNGYPINVLVITKVTSPQGRSINFPVGKSEIFGECLFYYQDKAESDYELGIAIDIFWKIWTTVIGYCNQHYQVRKSDTFPRLYNTFYEDFLLPVIEEWKYPKHNQAFKSIFGDLSTDTAQAWLDICLESSFIISNASNYRPPRPVILGDDATVPKQANYFLEIPDHTSASFNPINLSDPVDPIKCP